MKAKIYLFLFLSAGTSNLYSEEFNIRAGMNYAWVRDGLQNIDNVDERGLGFNLGMSYFFNEILGIDVSYDIQNITGYLDNDSIEF